MLSFAKRHCIFRATQKDLIFYEARDGALGKFINYPVIKPDDRMVDQVLGAEQFNTDAIMGGMYAPKFSNHGPKCRVHKWMLALRTL